MAGPYDEIPFENYIQSPIGLVPKVSEDKQNQTRLIFHLSYNFGQKNKWKSSDMDNDAQSETRESDPSEQSLNHHTPKEKCSVKYNDIDYTVRASLQEKRKALQEDRKENLIKTYKINQ